MKTFVVYDASTGEIFRWGECQDVDLSGNVTGGLLLEGSGTPADSFVRAGAIAAYTAAQATGKANRPTYAATWSNDTFTWTDVRTLSQVQVDQIGALSAAYAVAIRQSVSYVSKGGIPQIFQADPASIANVANMQLAFAAAATVPTGFYWVAADNTQVPFTYADVQGLAAAIGAQGFTAFARLQLRKTAVRAATTIAQALAVVW